MKTLGIVLQGMKIGGCERAVSYISLSLNKYFNIKIIVFDDNDISFKYGGELISLEQPSKRGRFNKIINSIKRVIKLKRVIKEKNIDILYIFLNPTNILNFYKPKKCKKFVSCRGFGDLLYGEKYKLYGIMTYFSDGIIFNSVEMKEYFSKRYAKLSSKAHVVTNFFDFDMIEELSAEQISKSDQAFIDSHKTIISVGRVCKEKNYINLVKAFEKLREKVDVAGLLIVGDGELFGELIQFVEFSKYKEDILLVGYQKNPYKFMKKCNLYALSSENEGFPNVLIEAMSNGLPVVSSNCKTGPSEILYNDYVSDREVYDIVYADYGILVPVMKEYSSQSKLSLSISIEIFAKALEVALINKDIISKYGVISIERAYMFDYKNNYKQIIDVLESK